MFLQINSFEYSTGLPVWIGFAFVFVLGALIGSFLNVVIHRVPLEESIIFPNSACPHCEKPIKPYDNLPILSWIFLGGKCRGCRQAISKRYPLVEFLTAILFVLTFWQIGFNPFLPVALVFTALMIALIFIDAEHMILPNVITYPLLAGALIVRIVFPILFAENYFPELFSFPLSIFTGQPLWVVSLFGAIFGAILGGGSLWLVGEVWKRLRGIDAMGLGDVKMMFGVGALLGWRLTFLTIFLGALTGAIAGVIVIAKSKDKNMQTQIPFGIFLGTGSILALLFGEKIINWYIENFIPV